MSDIKGTSKEVTQLQNGRSLILGSLTYAAKVGAAVGALVIAVAKTLPDPFGTILLSGAATFVFICAVIVLVGDDNASKVLARARIALDEALEAEAEFEVQSRIWDEQEDTYRDEIERLGHLQSAREIARQIFESVALQGEVLGEVAVIDRMLQQAKPSLFLAHAFEMNDHHTICVYQRLLDERTGKAYLKCVSHIREIDCAIGEARIWPEGVGTAGAALARGEEVVVPDLLDAALGTLLNLPTNKPEDDERYRSIAAEPVWSDHDEKEPWGVVCATSRVPHHFSLEDRDYVNATKTLAGMVSLAVKLVRGKQRAAEAVPKT